MWAQTTMMQIPSQSKQKGVALIIVLWIITLLSVIAISFVQTMRTDVNVVGNSLSRIKAETLADAALDRAIYELAKPQNIEGRWNADGSTREWTYRDIVVSITMQDETGRIDINRAGDNLLRGLLMSQGLQEEDALKLVDAIADWRDADSQKRLRGAEAADYAAAGLSQVPANALFQSVEELGQVIGMTPELFARLSPLVTIYSSQPGINEQIATREVLRAIPNVTEEQIDEYLTRRDLARALRQPIPTFPQNVFRSLSNNFTPVRIRAEAIFPDGNRFLREVVVRRYTDPKRPYAFLSWKEGRDLSSVTGAEDTANGNNSSREAATTGNNSIPTSGSGGLSDSPNRQP
jgi:general secretion pathway protein K